MIPTPRHVRDPRRSYLANKVRRPRVVRAVPVFDIPLELIDGLVSARNATVRTQALIRIQEQRGAEYATEVIKRVTDRLGKNKA